MALSSDSSSSSVYKKKNKRTLADLERLRRRRRLRRRLLSCYLNPRSPVRVVVQIVYGILTVVFVVVASVLMGYKTTFTGFDATGVRGSWTYNRSWAVDPRGLLSPATPWILAGDAVHLTRLCVSCFTARVGVHGLVVPDPAFALLRFVKGPWFFVYVAGGIPTARVYPKGLGVRGYLLACQIVFIWNTVLRFMIILKDLMEAWERASLAGKLATSFLLAVASYYVEIVLTSIWILWTVDRDCPTLGYGSLIGDNRLYPSLHESKGITVNFPSPEFRGREGNDSESFEECRSLTWLRTSCLQWPLFVDYVGPLDNLAPNSTRKTSDADSARRRLFGDLSYQIVGGTIDGAHKYFLFNNAWFFVSNNLRSIGVGEDEILSPDEIAVSILYNLIGLFYWCFIVFSLMNVAWKDLDESLAKLERSVAKLKFFFNRVSVNPSTALTSSVVSCCVLQHLRSDSDSHNPYVAALPMSYRLWIANATQLRLLRSIQSLVDVDARVLQILALELETTHYVADELIAEAGRHCDRFVYVVGGTLCMIVAENRDEAGVSRIEVSLNEGDFFGEKYLFMPLTAVHTIRTKTRCELLCLSRESFVRVTDQYPGMLQRLKRRFVERIRATASGESAALAARGLRGQDFLLIAKPGRMRRLRLKRTHLLSSASGVSAASLTRRGGVFELVDEKLDDSIFVSAQKSYYRKCARCRRCRPAWAWLLVVVAIVAVVFDFLWNDLWFHRGVAFLPANPEVVVFFNGVVVVFVVVQFVLHVFFPSQSDFGVIFGSPSILAKAPFLATYLAGAFVYEFQLFACILKPFALRLHPDFLLHRPSALLLYAIYLIVLVAFVRFVCYVSFAIELDQRVRTRNALCTTFKRRWFRSDGRSEIRREKVDAMCKYLTINSTRVPEEVEEEEEEEDVGEGGEEMEDKCFEYPERRIVDQMSVYCAEEGDLDESANLIRTELADWFFYVTQSVTNVGHGGIVTLASAPGIFILIIVTLFCFLVINCFYSHFSAVYENNIEPYLVFRQKTSLVKTYLRKREVDERLRLLVSDYHERHFFDFRSALDISAERRDHVFAEIPQRFFDAAVRNEYGQLVQECPLFKGIDAIFLRELTSLLRLDIFPPGCFLLRNDSTCDRVYFVRRGVCVERNRRGQVTRYLRDGGFCGNFGHQRRNVFRLNVVCVSYVVALSVELTRLDALVDDHVKVDFELQWIDDVLRELKPWALGGRNVNEEEGNKFERKDDDDDDDDDDYDINETNQTASVDGGEEIRQVYQSKSTEVKNISAAFRAEQKDNASPQLEFPVCNDAKTDEIIRKKSLVLRMNKEDKKAVKRSPLSAFLLRFSLLPFSLPPSSPIVVVAVIVFGVVDFVRVVFVVVVVTVGVGDSELSAFNVGWASLSALGVLRFYFMLHLAFYSEEGMLVWDPKLTILNYFRIRFLFDSLANFPLELVARLFLASNSSSIAFALNRLLLLWEAHRGFEHHSKRHSVVNMLRAAYFYALCSLGFSAVWYWTACPAEVGDASPDSNATFVLNAWESDVTKRQRCRRDSWAEPLLRSEEPEPPGPMRRDCLEGNLQLADISKRRNPEAIMKAMQVGLEFPPHGRKVFYKPARRFGRQPNAIPTVFAQLVLGLAIHQFCQLRRCTGDDEAGVRRRRRRLSPLDVSLRLRLLRLFGSRRRWRNEEGGDSRRLEKPKEISST